MKGKKNYFRLSNECRKAVQVLTMSTFVWFLFCCVCFLLLADSPSQVTALGVLGEGRAFILRGPGLGGTQDGSSDSRLSPRVLPGTLLCIVRRSLKCCDKGQVGEEPSRAGPRPTRGRRRPVTRPSSHCLLRCAQGLQGKHHCDGLECCFSSDLDK